MMVDLRSVGPAVSASTRTAELMTCQPRTFPGKPETQPDNMCSREQMRSVLGVAMKTLPERYQKVVFLYYTNEMTMKEIGGVLGVNESRVSQIHKSALEKMQVVLQANGIDSVHATAVAPALETHAYAWRLIIATGRLQVFESRDREETVADARMHGPIDASL